MREAQPWGLIVFRRNIAEPDALRRLTGDFRTTLGRDAPVLIDQEGGRVQRMGPPHRGRNIPRPRLMARFTTVIAPRALRRRGLVRG